MKAETGRGGGACSAPPWQVPRVPGLSPVLLEGQAHVLFHLLKAMIVRVDEVKRQRHGEWTVPPAWRHP